MYQTICISFYIFIYLILLCRVLSGYRYNTIQILIWIGIHINKGALCILNSDDAPLTFECSCFKFSHTLIYTSSAFHPFLLFSNSPCRTIASSNIHACSRKHVLYSIACKFCRSSSISHTHAYHLSLSLSHKYHSLLFRYTNYRSGWVFSFVQIIFYNIKCIL